MKKIDKILFRTSLIVCGFALCFFVYSFVYSFYIDKQLSARHTINEITTMKIDSTDVWGDFHYFEVGKKYRILIFTTHIRYQILITDKNKKFITNDWYMWQSDQQKLLKFLKIWKYFP